MCNKSILLVIVFFTALNINYAIAILPDHDQLETRLNDKEDVTDWGEVQVRHSVDRTCAECAGSKYALTESDDCVHLYVNDDANVNACDITCPPIANKATAAKVTCTSISNSPHKQMSGGKYLVFSQPG